MNVSSGLLNRYTRAVLVLLSPLVISSYVIAGPLNEGPDTVLEQAIDQAEFLDELRSAYDRRDFSQLLRMTGNSAPELNNDPVVGAFRMAALLLSDRPTEAMAEWKELAARSYLPGESALVVADAFRLTDDAARERAALHRGLIDSPGNAALFSRLGLLEATSGSHGKAALYLENALALQDNAVSIRDVDALARSYLSLFRYLDADAVYGRFSVDGSLRGLTHVHALLARGDKEGALKQLGTITYPTGTEAFFKARLQLAANRPQAALGALEGISQWEGQPPIAHTTRLLSLISAGEIETASSVLNDIDPLRDLIDPVPVALVLMAQGDAQGAAEVLKKLPPPLSELAANPLVVTALGRPEDSAALANTYFRYQLGFNELIIEADSNMTFTTPLLELIGADAARRAGELELSERRYTSLLERLPGVVSLRYQRALLLDEMGALDEADELLDSVLDERPDYIAAALARSSMLRDRALLKEAESVLLFSLNFRPESGALLRALAACQLDQGKLEEAAETIALLQDARGVSAASKLQQMGKLALLRNDTRTAIDRLERSVALRLDSPETLRLLSEAYAKEGTERRAETLGRLAIALDKTQP